MKYNQINDFRTYLVADKKLALKTARIYASAISFLLDNQFILDCKSLNSKLVLEKLESINYKGYYSICYNAFLYFCDFLRLEIPSSVFLRLTDIRKYKKKKYRKLKEVKLTDIETKLRYIRDLKLKTSFNTMLNTGLRVSELASIRKSDCIILDNSIELGFTLKGGAKEVISIPKEKSTYIHNLVSLIQVTDIGAKVFYSANYLQKQAKLKNFSCHDLRRIFAKKMYERTKDIDSVRLALFHKQVKDTKKYIFSKPII